MHRQLVCWPNSTHSSESPKILSPGIIIWMCLDRLCEQTYIQATHECIFGNSTWLICCSPYEMCIRAVRAIDFFFLFPFPCIVCINLSSLKVSCHGKHHYSQYQVASPNSISTFSTWMESIYHWFVFMQCSNLQCRKQRKKVGLLQRYKLEALEL